MLGSLLVLGFTLSLDNFRTALAFGGLPMSWRRSAEIAVDVRVLGRRRAPDRASSWAATRAEAIGSTAEIVGAIALGAYGLYLVIHAWLTPRPRSWTDPGRCMA